MRAESPKMIKKTNWMEEKPDMHVKRFIKENIIYDKRDSCKWEKVSLRRGRMLTNIQWYLDNLATLKNIWMEKNKNKSSYIYLEDI